MLFKGLQRIALDRGSGGYGGFVAAADHVQRQVVRVFVVSLRHRDGGGGRGRRSRGNRGRLAGGAADGSVRPRFALRGRGAVEDQGGSAELDLVAAFERRGLGDTDAVDGRTVGRAEVDDPPFVVAEEELGVLAGDVVVGQQDVGMAPADMDRFTGRQVEDPALVRADGHGDLLQNHTLLFLGATGGAGTLYRSPSPASKQFY